MRITAGKETVIVRGMRPEENWWGKYQFPCPYRLKDKIAVSVHVEDDTIITTGNPARWFESSDGGETWVEMPPSDAAECGLLLPNGDRIYFPIEGGTDVSSYKFPPFEALTPDYDFTKKAEEGEMPIQDGVTAWWNGDVIRAYNADRLPDSLSKKEWHIIRIPNGSNEKINETVPVDWKCLTRVVFNQGKKRVIKPIYPRGTPKLGPDGAIWVSAFSGEGHLNPENGKYSPYYSAEIFRSDDNGHSFKQHSHMEYKADGYKYPYLSGGFSDSDFEFFDDGSMTWFLRSTWMASTGFEWAPMYFSRSYDGGKSWTDPEIFSDCGVLPRLCRLDCGVTLLCYARPGMYLAAFDSKNGEKIGETLCIIEPRDRSGLANEKVEKPTWHQWDGQCGNPEIIPIGYNTALLFYGDFYYPDKNGVKRKTILCRKITVEK